MRAEKNLSPSSRAQDGVAEIMACEDKIFVARAYRAILERDPDDSGLDNYLTQLRAGAQKSSILIELHLSPEGQAKNLYVNGLDQMVAAYRRKQLSFWGRLLSLFSVYSSSSGANARENDAKSASVDANVLQAEARLALRTRKAFIERAYGDILGRKPDDAGASFYLERLSVGVPEAVILEELSQSDEAVAREQALLAAQALRKRQEQFELAISARSVDELMTFNGELFVDCAHKTFLERMPTTSEVDALVPLLKSKQAKLDVLAKLRWSGEGMKIRSYVKGVDELLGATRGKFESTRQTRHQFETATNNLWFDLTTSMEWTGGVVGIIRAELELAAGLKRANPKLRFSVCYGAGFVQIPESELSWLLRAENVADAYMQFFGRYKKADDEIENKIPAIAKLRLPAPINAELHHPFRAGDVLLSVGWMDSQKEAYFSRVKDVLPSLCLVYLVYDIILARSETSIFYHELGRAKFKRYLNWISNSCDLILYGGNTAKTDTMALQAEMGWPSPPGIAVQFGTDIVKVSDKLRDEDVLADLGVTEPFVLTVGTVEPRKNHETLYRAMLIALSLNARSTPQLVICGRPLGQVSDFVDTMERDPRVSGKIVRVAPTDPQLAVLYRRCQFTLLPSLYEGWSLTLPESLGNGKFCLAADTPPLREIGQEMVDYVHPWDAKGWAEKILRYSTDARSLADCEAKIAKRWVPNRWQDTAIAIHQSVTDFATSHSARALDPQIWLDITTSFLDWQGGVSGIIRSELTFARQLNELSPNVHFFAYASGAMFEVRRDLLLWLFDGADLHDAYASFQEFWRQHESSCTGYRNPFIASGVYPGHPAELREFPANSIVLFTCIDWALSRCKAAVAMRKKNSQVSISQLLYDFTPILFPHLHSPETCKAYGPFIEYVSEHFDHLVYGGRTAQRDGILIQKKSGWRTPVSDFMEFGSDIAAPVHSRIVSSSKDKETLAKLGVADKFIMTVGTIEPRKNHETLYKAYLTLLARPDVAELPQMLFIGRKGWKTDDFLSIFQADARVKGRIIILSPSDEELDALYRNCLFTLLPSHYEGWSLTLPESLSYGKFCLTSNADPLRETGRELVEYVDPFDTFAWADRILFYATHERELSEREAYIRSHWVPLDWKSATSRLLNAITLAHAKLFDDDYRPRSAGMVVF